MTSAPDREPDNGRFRVPLRYPLKKKTKKKKKKSKFKIDRRSAEHDILESS